MTTRHQHTERATISNTSPPEGGFPVYPYSGELIHPGGRQPVAGGGYPAPYAPPQAPAPPSSGGGSGSGFNFNEIKSMIDRMGGIDGVMSMMTKATKLISTVQQMSPMIKLVLGSFGSKAAVTKSPQWNRPRRRRRRSKQRSYASRPTYRSSSPRATGKRPRSHASRTKRSPQSRRVR